MYVRKFEADSLEEALKNIKLELGPDAIILKTITNKGLKGAFKKKKIEITAAISEKNYTKKARVDQTLDSGQKENFYSSNSSYISNMIDNHSENNDVSNDRYQVTNPGYGKMALNKTVNQSAEVNTASEPTGLDAFLTESTPKSSPVTSEELSTFDSFIDEPVAEINTPIETSAPVEYEEMGAAAEQTSTNTTAVYDNEMVIAQRNKIDELEKKLFELTRNVERIDQREPNGIFELRTTLRSLDISEKFIRAIIKKTIFELSDNDLQNSEVVFEFALSEMAQVIKTDMPLFSSTDESETPVITVLLSETSCGQTSMLQKLGALKTDSVLIRNLGRNEEVSSNFSEKVFGMNVVVTSSIAEIVAECRKATEAGKSVFVDYKNSDNELNEVKKFVEGLKRSFDKVEVLVSLSAIQSEIYNRKMISRYNAVGDGIVISNLDLCLNFGALFNISEEAQNLPFKFYGTGEIVPDDLEAATAERILAGIFQLS
jgi:flagellar biosynthesis GTPase FlhF